MWNSKYMDMDACVLCVLGDCVCVCGQCQPTIACPLDFVSAHTQLAGTRGSPAAMALMHGLMLQWSIMSYVRFNTDVRKQNK